MLKSDPVSSSSVADRVLPRSSIMMGTRNMLIDRLVADSSTGGIRVRRLRHRLKFDSLEAGRAWEVGCDEVGRLKAWLCKCLYSEASVGDNLGTSPGTS